MGRLTGIQDVARSTGVSTATVSRALRGLPNVSRETMERVRIAADALGYIPSANAAGLASGRTQAIGIVVPTVSHWYYTTVLEGVDAALRAAGYDTMLFNLGSRGGDRERFFHSSILRKRADALVALCMDFTAEERHQLASLDYPTVVVGGRVKGLRDVNIDDVRAAEMAMQHLFDLGHRDIAHVGGKTLEGLARRAPLERRKGYLRAMNRAGVPLREEWLLESEFELPSARIAFSKLLDAPGPKPTAVFAACDEMAIGVMLAAMDHGLRVPEDISVIGIDDHDWSASFGLTTIAQDAYAQGGMAARIVLDQLEGRPSPKRSVRAPVHLIRRGSTASAGGAQLQG